MQEEITQRTISICIPVTKLSGRKCCADYKKGVGRETEGTHPATER